MKTAQPHLTEYDWIVVSSSAGKDSQAMLHFVAGVAEKVGVDKRRIVVVHADLGRVEWEGTKELAERQAAHYGFRFEVVKRPQGDILDQVRDRYAKRPQAPCWPSSSARYCTSDHKRGQIQKLYTQLTAETRRTQPKDERTPVQILECVGLRAQESPARAKKLAFVVNKRASNGKRQVSTWHPLLSWTEQEVWDTIQASGVEHHYAYDLGMPRLSCAFCIFAPKAALAIAAEHNPELLDAYCQIEEETGWAFRQNLSLRDLRDEVRSGELVGAGSTVETWCM